MTPTASLDTLAREAARLRGRVIEVSGRAQVPHLGSCLSCLDMLAVLYGRILRIDPAAPKAPERDRFILSKGHAAPALFQVLAWRGFFPEAWLEGYGDDGSLFGEHPPAHGVPGVEAATGSLGHGLPMGVGMALGARLKGIPNRTFVLLSDGECNEGSVWEAALMGAVQQLESLTAIVDFNKWQATGRSEEVLALAPLAEKWRAFGWETVELDGHDLEALAAALSRDRMGQGRPLAIIAHTVKGKGVSFMEDDNNWHYRTPSPDEIAAAHRELGLLP
ncbi:MAG: transketolase [Acidobacteria bacterium]|nr:transketolase [Acidobacteriota bacterium]